MGRILAFLKETSTLRRQYYIDFKSENTDKNLNILFVSSLCSLVLLTVLLLATPFLVKNWRMTWEYACLVPTFAVFLLFTLVYRRHENKRADVVYGACILFCVALIICIILVDVFPYPLSPSSFFPLILIVLPVIFILRLRDIFSLAGVAEVVYVFLVGQVKEEAIAQNDIFNSLVALLFSFVVATIVTNLRIRDNSAKLTYQKLSAIDGLTGVSNKASCEKRVAGLLTQKAPDLRSVLFILDIDNFKEVNDTLGHQAGDAVLTQTGIVLRRIFGNDGVIGRIGGDEFMVFIRDAGSPDRMKDRCTRLLDNIQEDIMKNLSVCVTVSMGVIVFTKETSFEKLFRLADNALYDAKYRGKGRYVLNEYDGEE